MATRFYLSSTAAAAISPAFDIVQWTNTTSGDRRKMATTKDSSLMTSKTTGSGFAAITKCLNRQYISDQLGPQTLSISAGGDMIAQIRASLSSATSTIGNQYIILRVVSSDGVTFRSFSDGSTHYIGSSGTLTTTLTNKTLSGSGGVSVAIQNGDRIVIEIGWNYSSGTNTTRTVTQSFGADNATDLPNDNTTTTANNPFIEFSQTIIFFSAVVAKPRKIYIIG